MSAEIQFAIKSLDGAYRFVFDEEIKIGRDSTGDAVVADKGLSRAHARLFMKGKVPHVEDLNSTNGTFVNGNRLEQEPQALRYNDIIRFDRLEFLVVAEFATDDDDVHAQSQLDSSEKNVVVEGSTRSKKKAPLSWAVHEEPGQGTVIMDVNAPDKNLGAQKEKQVSVGVDQALSEKLDQPALIGLRGIDSGKTIILATSADARTVWQMGRDPEMDIFIDDPSVSEHQAQIVFEQGTWKLVDVISTNATYVNGSKVLAHYLSNGDTFTFGPVEYMFRVNTDAGFRPRTKNDPSKANKKFWLLAAAVIATTALAGYILAVV